MILNDTEINERLESPLNLMNRLRLSNKGDEVNHPSIPPKAEDVIDELTEKLNYGSIKSKAANIMISCMDELKARIPEVQKPEKLAAIAESMSKVVNAEVKKKDINEDNRPQIVIFAPQVMQENNYSTMVVND